jgi:hypothetical protein
MQSGAYAGGVRRVSEFFESVMHQLKLECNHKCNRALADALAEKRHG